MTNIRLYIIIFFATLGYIAAKADTTALDSLSVNMREVTVTQELRIQKADTLVVIPSAQQRKVTVNGYELLRSLMLPDIFVNAINAQVTTLSNQSVVITLDGRPVEKQDILAIQPKNVAKVEYLTNPGPEYGYSDNIGAVINFVSKERIDGYAAGMELANAVTSLGGENFAYGKYNRGKSECNLSLNSTFISPHKRSISEENSYLLGTDWTTVDRRGINKPLEFSQQVVSLGYNYFVPQKHLFNATLRWCYYYSPDRAIDQIVTVDGQDPYFARNKEYERYSSPKLDLYYKHYISSKQAITTNVVGTYRSTHYHYRLNESPLDQAGSIIDSYGFGVDGRKYSLITEAKYYNAITTPISVHAGARYHFSLTQNQYTGDDGSYNQSNDHNLYSYAGIYGKVGQLTYRADCGMSARWLDQNHQKHNTILFRPTVVLSYPLGGWKFTLSGSTQQNSPSLSQLTTSYQQVNQWEIMQGNPLLKDYQSYRARFQARGRLGIFNVSQSLFYQYYNHPVTTSYALGSYDDEPVILESYANQNHGSAVYESLSLQGSLLGCLHFSVGVNYNWRRFTGPTVNSRLSHWQGMAALELTVGNWNAGINWYSATKDLWGDTFSSTAASNQLIITYTWRHWRFGVNCQNLFLTDGPVMRERSDNPMIKKSQVLKCPSHGNMVMITIAYNISGGRSHKAGTQDLNNDDTDAGIMHP